jgi:hypothetical protein
VPDDAQKEARPKGEETTSDEAQREQLFQARRRGIVAFAVTALIAGGIFLAVHVTGDLAGSSECKVARDCDGMLGECLHAPTGNYCTHSCSNDEDCYPKFRCDSPSWEKGTTRLVCLRQVVPGKN